mmetsp:Transcript_40632/g.63827  ORF Transcript_40632/g.63827 Transcript_40632/m.63827 type:complete len:200 (-) Transcript_40632:867-1466(-)
MWLLLWQPFFLRLLKRKPLPRSWWCQRRGAPTFHESDHLGTGSTAFLLDGRNFDGLGELLARTNHARRGIHAGLHLSRRPQPGVCLRQRRGLFRTWSSWMKERQDPLKHRFLTLWNRGLPCRTPLVATTCQMQCAPTRETVNVADLLVPIEKEIDASIAVQLEGDDVSRCVLKFNSFSLSQMRPSNFGNLLLCTTWRGH